MKLTHHSTDMDIVDRLEYASMSTPEIHLLREAAQYIRKLREELADAQDDSIVIHDKDGNELCVIEGPAAEHLKNHAISDYVTNALRHILEEYGQEH